MKRIMIVTALLVASTTVFANEGEKKESAKPEAQVVNASCSEDAKTAGCGDDKVGTGLLKCLHAYKKSHSDFKFSDGCKTAMKDLRKEHKGHR